MEREHEEEGRVPRESTCHGESALRTRYALSDEVAMQIPHRLGNFQKDTDISVWFSLVVCIWFHLASHYFSISRRGG